MTGSVSLKGISESNSGSSFEGFVVVLFLFVFFFNDFLMVLGERDNLGHGVFN